MGVRGARAAARPWALEAVRVARGRLRVPCDRGRVFLPRIGAAKASLAKSGPSQLPGDCSDALAKELLCGAKSTHALRCLCTICTPNFAPKASKRLLLRPPWPRDQSAEEKWRRTTRSVWRATPEMLIATNCASRATAGPGTPSRTRPSSTPSTPAPRASARRTASLFRRPSELEAYLSDVARHASSSEKEELVSSFLEADDDERGAERAFLEELAAVVKRRVFVHHFVERSRHRRDAAATRVSRRWRHRTHNARR